MPAHRDPATTTSSTTTYDRRGLVTGHTVHPLPWVKPVMVITTKRAPATVVRDAVGRALYVVDRKGRRRVRRAVKVWSGVAVWMGAGPFVGMVAADHYGLIGVLVLLGLLLLTKAGLWLLLYLIGRVLDLFNFGGSGPGTGGSTGACPGHHCRGCPSH